MTSIYLDAVRFLAALAVFVSHADTGKFSGGLLWQVHYYGHEAVAVFFVLSGFVIACVTDTRETTVADYAVNRLARIASVAWPALAIGFALDAVGRLANPASYDMWPLQSGVPTAAQAVAAGLFLNEAWDWHIVPGSNLPYWSMGFEVWFYAAFAAMTFAPARWRMAATALTLLLAGPRIALMFPIWLIGVAAWRWTRRRTLAPRAGAALWLVALSLLAAIELAQRPRGMMYAALGTTPARLMDYLQFYSVGLLVAATLVGVDAAARFASPLLTWQRPVRWLAGGTFALYLLHVPLMQFVVAVSPWPTAAWPTRAAVFLGVPVACYALAEVTERRKAFWRRLFGGITAPRLA